MQIDLPFEHAASGTPHPAPGTAPSTPHPAPHPAPSTPHAALVLVRHPRARRYVVGVRADGTVRVTIPRWGSRRDALAFAREQQPWIERQLRRVEEEQSRPRPPAIAPEVEREVRARAARDLPARLLDLAARFGIAVSRVSVRNQRWRWGSCSPSGHICLNWRLAQMPDAVRDYVMIHELMHLERLDHSPKFWKLVARACPDYQSARQWLRAHPL